MGFGKKPTNDTIIAATAGMVQSESTRSFPDIFATETSEQAKGLIMSGVRHELYHSHSRVTSESASEDYIINRVDPVDLTLKPTIVRVDKNARKPTMLLAGPKFRAHTVDPEYQVKRDTIYPIAVKYIFCF
jgi:glycerol-3-phosphate dehydrogenase